MTVLALALIVLGGLLIRRTWLCFVPAAVGALIIPQPYMWWAVALAAIFMLASFAG